MSSWNLLLALEDEYKAYGFYSAAIPYGQIFANLQSAEATHIQALQQHLQNLGVAIPENPYLEQTRLPTNLQEILTTALANENANVELYNRLIANESDENVLDTFYRLQAASFNHHIPALQYALNQANTNQTSGDSMQNLQNAIKALNDGKELLNETGEMIAKMQNGSLSQMELEGFLNKLNYSLIGGLIVGALGANLLNEFLNQNKE
ncbi:hypothetical protein [Helicobacter sp. MIT 05-5294]|uniref:hypothetical protein n=1 Tax=Helicobacter sp. MIT 05-5294 TaxID=1548150 RepID=UPI00051FBF6B|nr:hypothetical protein [Helicobacter sp. MIT 05-5294]TLD87845.1 hypothetical protein LS69_003380 [Helicobacter sp. MIT 05-5294]